MSKASARCVKTYAGREPAADRRMGIHMAHKERKKGFSASANRQSSGMDTPVEIFRLGGRVHPLALRPTLKN
ncbi:MAG: hypothetical protein ACLR23_27465 [Clostridia bacterium]